jgi:drug/metabolite transporter (DMT)-like permease
VQGIGIALALVGIVLAAREPSRSGSRVTAGAALGVTAALGFGLAFVGIDAGSAGDPYWTILILRLVSTTAVLSAALAFRPTSLPPAGLLPTLALVGLLDMAAGAMFAVATTRGLVSVVSVLASLYPVLVVALARVVLREHLARAQKAGAATALTGAALVSAG